MFTLIDPKLATGRTKHLLDDTSSQLGRVPNLYRAMANSPSGLAGYLAFRFALQDGVLDTKMRERIALLTAQINHCDYCIAAHHFRSTKLGLPDEDLADVRRARSQSPKIHAALEFVEALLRGRGQVDPVVQSAMTEQGWSDEEVGEMVAHVALNVFSNYFKHVAQPPLDFPEAPELRS